MCKMTKLSGACDNSAFDSNTILVGSDDTGCNGYVFFSAFENITLSIEDEIIDFITLMGSKLIPTVTAAGKKY